MKEKLTLRNAIIWTAALGALILFFCSFGASGSLKGMMEDFYCDFKVSHVIWGCNVVSGTAGGHPMTEILSKSVANAPGIIGAILLFLASGGLVATTFLIKDEKLAKILIFVCAGLMLVAGVLLFFVVEASWYVYKESLLEQTGIDMPIDVIKANHPGFKSGSVFAIVGGIFAILFAGGAAASQFIPDRKLVK